MRQNNNHRRCQYKLRCRKGLWCRFQHTEDEINHFRSNEGRRILGFLRHSTTIPIQEDGFVQINHLIEHYRRKTGRNIDEQELRNIIRQQKGTTIRIQIRNGKIRALYGHSNKKIENESLFPIEITNPEDIEQAIYGTWDDGFFQGYNQQQPLYQKGIGPIPNQYKCKSFILHQRFYTDDNNPSWKPNSILIYIDVHLSMEQGIKWFKHEQEVLPNVVFCLGDNNGFIKPHLFQKVVYKDRKNQIIFEHGNFNGQWQRRWTLITEEVEEQQEIEQQERMMHQHLNQQLFEPSQPVPDSPRNQGQNLEQQEEKEQKEEEAEIEGEGVIIEQEQIQIDKDAKQEEEEKQPERQDLKIPEKEDEGEGVIIEQEQTYKQMKMSKYAPFHKGKSRLGIDCGRVISFTDTDKNLKISLSEYYQQVKINIITDACIDAVSKLVKLFGQENTFILSKCGRKMQQTTVIMFGKNDFYNKTGLLKQNVYFCTKRYGGISNDLKFQQLESPHDALNEELMGFEYPGANVAVQDCGKGIIAQSLCLTHMIDDRADCLASFFFEGHLPMYQKNADQYGSLFHFGQHAHIYQFLNGKIQKLSQVTKVDDFYTFCQCLRFCNSGWSDVLNNFKEFNNEIKQAKIIQQDQQEEMQQQEEEQIQINKAAKQEEEAEGEGVVEEQIDKIQQLEDFIKQEVKDGEDQKEEDMKEKQEDEQDKKTPQKEKDNQDNVKQ